MASFIDWTIRPKVGGWLEFHRITGDSQDLVFVKDPRDLADGPVAIPYEFFPLVSLFDGSRTLEQIAGLFADNFQYSIDDSERIVGQLYRKFDELWLLDNERGSQRLSECCGDFRALPSRSPILAGSVYPSDRKELRALLTKYLNSPEIVSFYPPSNVNIDAIMFPHIDYARGWKGYGSAYSALEKTEKPDLIVIFGTTHHPIGRTFFQLTDKQFETPFGPFVVDKELINNIVSSYGEARCFADEIVHKTEHSIELQLPFLGYRFEEAARPLILPILVGSFDEFLKTDREPIVEPEIQEFFEIISWLLSTLKKNGARVLFYSAANLAHVGEHFGNEEELSDPKLKQIRDKDTKLLETVFALDAQNLFFHLAADRNKRKVSGFSAIYTMTSILRSIEKKSRGYFIDYRQSLDEKRSNLITFASAAWCSERSSPTIDTARILER